MRQKIQKQFIADYSKKYERKYFPVPHEIWESEKFQKLSSSTIRFYIHLCKLSNHLADSDGWFYRPMQELRKETKLSTKTIRKAKKELENNHCIDIGRAYYLNSNIHYSDCYRVNGFKNLVF